ncbi:hypothetical protein AB4144_17195, partial [Rhizobiaceae sp. 2RAB30]
MISYSGFSLRVTGSAAAAILALIALSAVAQEKVGQEKAVQEKPAATLKEAAAFDGIADKTARSVALFEEAGKVIQ